MSPVNMFREANGALVDVTPVELPKVDVYRARDQRLSRRGP